MRALQEVERRVIEALDELEPMFKPGVKFTFVARRPDAPDGSQDIVISADDLNAVIEALHIQAARSHDAERSS